MSEVAEHLRRVPLFQGMTDEAIEAVAALATETTFEPGDELTREGEPGDTFLVLVDGSVAVSRHSWPVATLGPGDFLGEISLVDGRPRSATSVAESRVKALLVRRPEFLELFESYGAVRLGILMALTARIRSDETSAVV